MKQADNGAKAKAILPDRPTLRLYNPVSAAQMQKREQVQ